VGCSVRHVRRATAWKDSLETARGPNLSRPRHLNRLSENLALLVRREESDIRRIATASDPDDPFDWRKSRRIDQPPAIFDVDFKDGMKVGRVELKRIGAYSAGGDTQRSGQCNSQMSEVAADARSVYKSPLCRRLSVADARNIVDVAVDPFQYSHDARHAVASGAELPLRESHKFV
jgi:hypothetical protein